jgi:hypothetical protein
MAMPLPSVLSHLVECDRFEPQRALDVLGGHGQPAEGAFVEAQQAVDGCIGDFVLLGQVKQGSAFGPTAPRLNTVSVPNSIQDFGR